MARTKKKRKINFDKLQEDAEKLVSLLKDRQPGLFTWNAFLHERLRNLRRLTSHALGKSAR